MEHRNISLFRGYSDTESVETSLEEIVNIIKCDAALRDRTEKHRYYLQQYLRRDADREKSGCPCFAVAVCFEGGKTREHICAWTGYTLVDLDHIAPERICSDSRTFLKSCNIRQISSRAANSSAGSDSSRTCWNSGRKTFPICGMTRQNCRNSICRKKIWRRSLRRWGKTHWKFTNGVSLLLQTLCNFGTRSGCY